MLDSDRPMGPPSLPVRGLQHPVEIRRDAYGVPHISAMSDTDAFFSLGWVMATDRLFQMDLNRRTILGRLSELTTTDGTLASDRLYRSLGMRQVADGMLALLPESTRALLVAFTDGVNRWLEAHPSHREAEYQVLRLEEIAPWELTDSLAIIRLIGWQLAGDFDKELFAWDLVRSVGAEHAALLFPDIPPVGERMRMLQQWPLSDGQQLHDLAGDALDALGRAENGTNIWVLEGSKTANGRPLLANDPHLNLAQPGIWYEVGLQSPSFSISGFTFPGIPFIAIGQNQQLAWGAANWPADTQDCFIERLNPAGDQYQDATGGWSPLELSTEVLHCRGRDDETLMVRRTPRGVIVRVEPDGTALALRWTGFEASDELTAFLRASQATTLTDWLAAFDGYACPTQNFYCIHRSEGIAGIHAGAVPRRTRGESSFPQEAHDPAAAWEGLLPAAEFGPRRGSGGAGWLANANNKPLEAASGAPSGVRFTPPLRYRRIQELLSAQDGWTVEATRQMQTDTVNLAARDQLVLLRQHPAAQACRYEDPVIATGWSRLLAWDADHCSDPTSAALWHALTLELARLLCEPLMGLELWSRFQDLHDPQHLLLIAWLEGGLTESLDLPVPTPELLQQAFLQAWRDLVILAGDDSTSWDWAEIHAMRLRHPMGLPVGRAEGLRIPHPGGRHTLNVGNFWPSQGWRCSHGVSLRYIAWVNDTGVLRSESLVLPGTAGDPASPHADDQIGLFQRGVLRERPVTAEAIAQLPLEVILTPDSA
ncbi:MAG: Penicillin acylase 2 proenzyme [bacterium]|nr:Penicillin acylase 2 proenzyme [bacterium]